jgi:hypothetical protein
MSVVGPGLIRLTARLRVSLGPKIGRTPSCPLCKKAAAAGGDLTNHQPVAATEYRTSDRLAGGFRFLKRQDTLTILGSELGVMREKVREMLDKEDKDSSGVLSTCQDILEPSMIFNCGVGPLEIRMAKRSYSIGEHQKPTSTEQSLEAGGETW